jgi:hypothetical protein
MIRILPPSFPSSLSISPPPSLPFHSAPDICVCSLHFPRHRLRVYRARGGGSRSGGGARLFYTLLSHLFKHLSTVSSSLCRLLQPVSFAEKSATCPPPAVLCGNHRSPSSAASTRHFLVLSARLWLVCSEILRVYSPYHWGHLGWSGSTERE